MTNANETRPLLTATECGEILGISAHAVQVQCKQGKLPARLIGKRWYINREKLISLAWESDKAEAC